MKQLSLNIFLRIGSSLLGSVFTLTCTQPLVPIENKTTSATPTSTISQTTSPARKLHYFELSEGTLLGAAIKRVYPECPLQVRCKVKVQVRIEFDEEGVVQEATVLNAQPPLRIAVEKAALAWRFKPTNDMPPKLRFVGVLTFNLDESNRTK